jgi:hypothetical protein
MAPSILMTIQQADTTTVTIVQVLLVAIALLLVFPVSIGATGFMAKKIFKTEEVYIEALWATVFKGVGFATCSAVLAGMLGMAPELVLILAGVILPIIIYKIVYSSTVVQASLIYLGVIAVELVAGTALVLGALAVGAWLDARYDFPAIAGIMLASQHQRFRKRVAAVNVA